MKRVNNLYFEICKLDNIIDMTDRVCKKTRNKNKVNMFELYKMEHIYNIKKRLDNRDFSFERYNIFMISDPKVRIVMALDIEDKIINHLVSEYCLNKVFEGKYLDCMCATRRGKGTLYGIKLLKKYINEIKRKYDNFYVLKIDIRKYFYNIDHDVLKNILRKKIKDKDVLMLLDKIIDSTNYEYVNNKIRELKEKRIDYLKKSNIGNKDKLIDEVDKIPLYAYGKGVALGNQTSQAFGLIYLYEMMYYMKNELKLSRIVNYMDDIMIIHHDKEYLMFFLEEIKFKLKEEYKLDINIKKTRIDNIKNGIDFLGYRFYIKNNKVIMKIRHRVKDNFIKKVKELRILYDNNIISRDEMFYYLASYNGLLKWGNCKNLYYERLGEYLC